MKNLFTTAMKRAISLVTGVVILAFSVTLNAMSPTRTNTIADIIFDSHDHETLEAAIKAADIEDALRGHDHYTVFAPTDDAFAALPEGTLDALLADPEGLLTDILWYHAIPGSVTSSHFSDGQMITTVQGKEIEITIKDHKFFVNDAEITVKDIHADNGVVHVIDAVLSIPKETVADVVVENDHLNTLEAAVKAAGLVETLSGEGPFTVFAPTDVAFHNLPEGVLDALLDDPEGALTDVLLYHVVDGKALSKDLSDGQKIETLLGEDVMVTINSEGVFINHSEVIVKDIETDNGVVHIIDAVLTIPPTSVFDIIEESEDHNTLETAIREAHVVETLNGEGPFTVFAPTDDAFSALPEGTLEALLDDPSGILTDILLYHVVAGKALSTDLSDGQMIETVLGENVKVTINEQGVFINDAKVKIANIDADNGVVHVIDAVLTIPPTTVVDVIAENDHLSVLEEAVKAAGLVETLSGKGPFTVFAPTDAAFDALPEGTLDALLADPTGDLTDILFYHVVAGKAMSTDLSNGQMIETILGKDIIVTINEEGVFINDAQVTVADIETDNGVVHVIDAVLTPPTTTVVDIIVKSEVHKTLEAAVIAADLVETLQGEGPFTVFAPTDDAFKALPEGTLDALLADPSGELTEILLYHVVAGKALSTDLSDGQMIETVLGDDIKVTISEEGVFINDAKVIIADIMADNGVIHVIDAVLTPPTTTVVDIVVNSEDHNTLESAVKAAGLVETLSGKGPFTLFAPTDAAFDALPEGTLDALLADPTGDLTDILFYHVVAGKAMSTDLSNGQMIETILGKDIIVTINEEGVFINDAQVTVADIEADNGVVHVIDAVLIPPVPETVVDIIVDSEIHETLEAAVIAADLVEVLSGEGPFTVFAPTDAAFEALPEGTLDALLADPDGALAEILTYHVVAGKALSTDLSDGQVIETVLGENITVTINADGVFINDSKVIVADIEAGNGVVHVIDAVLTPSTGIFDSMVEEEMFRIYPNPAREWFTLEMMNTNSFMDGNLEIIRMDGTIMRTMNINEFSTTIEVSEFDSGIYFIRYTKGNRYSMKRMVIQK